MVRKLTLGALPLIGLATAGQARAADCVLGANAVVVAGSSAIEPLIKNISGALNTQAAIDVFYAGVGSCTGTNNLVKADDLAGKSANHYDGAGNKETCTLPTGAKANVAISDVFFEVCTPAAASRTGFTDFQGPVASMVFVAPKMSMQTTLTANEGYYVFGYGTAGYQGKTVAPWTDQTKFIIRNMGSGTQQMTARAVGVPPESMKGVDAGGSGAVVTMLGALNASPATADPAIGILGSDVYDSSTNRAALKALFFKAFNQTKPYLPDSKSTTFDKKNVREGRYGIWGPVHIIAATGASGRATNAKVADLIDVIQLKKPLTTTSVLDVLIDSHLVPQCAMKVSRTSEMGPIGACVPAAAERCGCYMDEHLQAGSSGCVACSATAPCGAGKTCSHGFCE